MLAYLLRRTAFLLVSLVLAMVLMFVLLRLLPGDPANALISVNATQEQIDAARRQVGSDQPMLQQFTTWFGEMLRLDLGRSFVSSLPVGDEIGQRMTVTVPLTITSFVIATVLATLVGFTAAWRSHTWYGSALSMLSQLGIAIPVFWVGILLVTVFAVTLGWFPSGGIPVEGWADGAGMWHSLVLPVTTISLIMGASLTRYVRSATLDVLGSDYLRNARALGATTGQAMLRHGLRNGAVPVIAILGIELATTFLGAVVVEAVFTLPGLGSMLLTAVAQHDYPNIQGVLFVSTVLVLVIGFAADVAQRLVDPRLRTQLAVT